jgi:hypothetical protein
MPIQPIKVKPSLKSTPTETSKIAGPNFSWKQIEGKTRIYTQVGK